MSEVVAKRYAEALFDVAKSRGTVDAVENQLQLVSETVSGHAELENMLHHPRISGEDKKKVVEQIFQNDVNQEVLNLLKVLIDRHRESILEELKEAYTKLANEYRGLIDMTVITASPLNKEEEEKLTEAFGRLFDKKLRLTVNVDPKIIGGVLVKVGNRLYDGTMAGKLARFSQELKAVR